MPLDVIFVHGIVGLVRQTVCLKLVKSGMIAGLELLHLALSPGKLLLQAQTAEGRPNAKIAVRSSWGWFEAELQ